MSYDAISPIDGRYRREAEPLAAYFSEGALNQERVSVELAYLSLLVRLGVAPRTRVPRLNVSLEKLKAIEGRVGHDVKAVEVYIRDSLKDSESVRLGPYVHLGLTSEDTNSLAFALLLKSALQKVLIPAYSALARELAAMARDQARTVMLARTHGRPAVPTTFGKELAIFAVRIAERVSLLSSLRPMAKFSGAVGTFASFSLMGAKDWPRVLGEFVASMGVEPAAYSTQVVPGERLSDILHCVVNINQLILSLSRDLWLYQALDYVHFTRPGKVSSSTMPQKVNPVDLENAEGQVEVSNSLLTMMAYRLQLTRMQRDLSDSVIRRMVGQALAHSLVASSRLSASLDSMKVEAKFMRQELLGHPEVLAEAEQVSLRLRGDESGYERVSAAVKKGVFVPFLKDPESYLGEAPRLAEACPKVVSDLLRPRA
ncbi:MAG: lyase family protein [Thaumarchaeota archaeon]|nr:lyase family protein [Nitrososphaerota archaeon]